MADRDPPQALSGRVETGEGLPLFRSNRECGQGFRVRRLAAAIDVDQCLSGGILAENRKDPAIVRPDPCGGMAIVKARGHRPADREAEKILDIKQGGRAEFDPLGTGGDRFVHGQLRGPGVADVRRQRSGYGKRPVGSHRVLRGSHMKRGEGLRATIEVHDLGGYPCREEQRGPPLAVGVTHGGASRHLECLRSARDSRYGRIERHDDRIRQHPVIPPRWFDLPMDRPLDGPGNAANGDSPVATCGHCQTVRVDSVGRHRVDGKAHRARLGEVTRLVLNRCAHRHGPIRQRIQRGAVSSRSARRAGNIERRAVHPHCHTCGVDSGTEITPVKLEDGAGGAEIRAGLRGPKREHGRHDVGVQCQVPPADQRKRAQSTEAPPCGVDLCDVEFTGHPNGVIARIDGERDDAFKDSKRTEQRQSLPGRSYSSELGRGRCPGATPQVGGDMRSKG